MSLLSRRTLIVLLPLVALVAYYLIPPRAEIDRLMNELATLDSLKYATFNDVTWNNQRMRAFSRMTKFKAISLFGHSCKGFVIEAVSRKRNLQGLALFQVDITDADARKPANLTDLRTLVFERVKLKDQTLREIRRRLPNTYVSYLR